MNAPKSPAPPFIDPLEWRRQEAALRAERLSLDERADTGDTAYRQVVRALRAPRPDGLPEDFAARMAKRVGAAPARATRGVPAWELGLYALFGALLPVLGALLVHDMPDAAWRNLMRNPLVSLLGNRWLLTLLACTVLSGLLEGVRRRHARS